MGIQNVTIRNVPVATFETSLEKQSANKPLVALKIPVQYSQDLNGYTKPWPGGAGKNKLEVTLTERTVNGVTFTKNADGTISATGTATANAGTDVSSSTPPPGTYILNGNTEGASSSTYRMRYRIDGGRWVYRNSTDESADITLDGSQTFELVADVISGQTVSGVLWKPMLRLATETDPTYEPYANICPIVGKTGLTVYVSPTTEPTGATTYPVTWQTEAGEVGIGEIDVVSGVLTVTHEIWVLDGTQTYTQNGADIIAVTNENKYKITQTPKSSQFVGIAQGASSRLEAGQFRLAANFNSINFRFGAEKTVAEWTAELATNPVQVLMQLATPVTYQLTGQQVMTLAGLNNIWSDSGDIGELTYSYFVFDILKVRINGVDITDYIAYNGLQRGRNDVESPNAGRTLDAVMHRGRVATKLRWDVTCRPLKVDELSVLENLIMPETIMVTIEGDPFYGTWTRRCYANNTSAAFLILRPDGTQLWSGITFPIIEV